MLPIYGGQSIGHEIRALQQGVQIVIGTPGRDVGSHSLWNLEPLIFARWCSMRPTRRWTWVSSTTSKPFSGRRPAERETLLFSATFTSDIKRLAVRYMKSPEHVTVNRGEVTVDLIDQVYDKVLERNKSESLCGIVDSEEVKLGIIFCRTKRGVDVLVEALLARGYSVDGLHGDLSQAERDRVMNKFRRSEVELLVATDVAGRGIDVDNVTHVTNYDIPQDPESYVHRIGRTGGAGKRGSAITL